MITEQYYRYFQQQLAQNSMFRIFWTFWSNYAFIFFIIAAVIIVLTQSSIFWREVFLLALISFVIARGILVTLINLLYRKQRPYQKFNFAPITSKFFSWKTAIPNSFPSRHTTAYFSVASVILLFFPGLGIALILIALLAGSARVVLGFHWPADIAAGAILGTIVGVSTVLIGHAVIFT